MAAHDYFQGLNLDNHSTLLGPQQEMETRQPSYRPYAPSANFYASRAPSYTSTDRLRPEREASDDDSPPDGIHRTASPYSDNILLKKQAKLDTSQEGYRNQGIRSPPSPESPTARNRERRQRHKPKKNGWFTGKIAWVVYLVTLIQITVFIAEIIENSMITGSPIMIHPQFNPMIGPSTYVMINMGARFVPCMRTTPGVQDSTIQINWPCPNTTTSDPNAASNHCDLSALCGFSGLNDANPNQWFRFIVPMFLHAGLVHIGFNMLLQLTMGREMEIAIGSIRFALVYFSSGIFGFVLGGNFAATAIASTGASGCLFGILALTLLDLIYCWNERTTPIRDLMWILADILISLVLGLLPGLDNFSHIGGFLMGLVAGICILHSPNVLRQRISRESAPFHTMPTADTDADASSPWPSPAKSATATAATATASSADVAAFAKQPVGFFKGRKPLWWAWWLLRAGALVGVLVLFVVLLNNFYKYRDTCSWCKYLSCLPINNWCSIGNLQLTNTTTTNSKRDLLSSSSPMAMAELLRLGTLS